MDRHENTFLSWKLLKYCIPIKSPRDYYVAFPYIGKKRKRTLGHVPSELVTYFCVDTTASLNCPAENIQANPTGRKKKNNFKLRLKHKI